MQIESFSSSIQFVIISIFISNYALGLYSVAFKPISIIILIFQSLMIVLAPYIVDLKIQKKIN